MFSLPIYLYITKVFHGELQATRPSSPGFLTYSLTSRKSSEIEKENEDICQHYSTKSKEPKEQAPSPTTDVTDYSVIKTLMQASTNKEYKVTTLNNAVWKINTPDSDTYRTITAKLKESEIQWYTYENNTLRPIKVMV